MTHLHTCALEFTSSLFMASLKSSLNIRYCAKDNSIYYDVEVYK